MDFGTPGVLEPDCMHTYIHVHKSLILATVGEGDITNSPVAMSTSHPWFLTPSYTKEKQGSREKWLSAGLGQGKNKGHRLHLAVSRSKGGGGHAKGKRSHPVPNWDNNDYSG